LPDEDMQIGVLLALLQDDAKNQSSYLTWGEGRRRRKCGDLAPRFPGQRRARRQTLGRVGAASAYWANVSAGVSRRNGESRALRRTFPPERVLPAIYGCFGMVDINTVDEVLRAKA
jgi:hypothetical protein